MADNEGIYPFVVDTPATALQQFRILTNDDSPVQIGAGTTGTYLFLSDASALGLLALYNDNPRLAAARQLETIAVSQALLLKVFTQDDLSVNGAALANALRQLAAQMRDEVVNGDSEDGFDIVSTGDNNDYDAWPPEGSPWPFPFIWPNNTRLF